MSSDAACTLLNLRRLKSWQNSATPWGDSTGNFVQKQYFEQNSKVLTALWILHAEDVISCQQCRCSFSRQDLTLGYNEHCAAIPDDNGSGPQPLNCIFHIHGHLKQSMCTCMCDEWMHGLKCCPLLVLGYFTFREPRLVHTHVQLVSYMRKSVYNSHMRQVQKKYCG